MPVLKKARTGNLLTVVGQPDVDIRRVGEGLQARFDAVLDDVAAAPPPRCSGGGSWEALHGEMGGF